MTTTSTTPAPRYIEADTYTGRHSVTLTAQTMAVTMTAAELAAEAECAAVFESVGHVNGREHFARCRYIATPAGDLYLYAADGSLVVIHPASRPLRVLRGRP